MTAYNAANRVRIARHMAAYYAANRDRILKQEAAYRAAKKMRKKGLAETGPAR
jgi:bisphosphoglycerate-independent phosphoglycerate mutase (AlkP superfamily)